MTQAAGAKTSSCILLTLNEEGAIAKVVADIRRILPDAEIVVVDSSTDKTAEIAESLAARLFDRFRRKAMAGRWTPASKMLQVTTSSLWIATTHILPRHCTNL